MGGKIKTSEQLIKKFCRTFKKSGIIKELKEREYPVTRGMKRRKKKEAAKRRARKKLSSKT